MTTNNADTTAPTNDQRRPLLEKARQCSNDYGNRRRAVARFDPETGELLAGPVIIDSGYVDWSCDGINVSESGPFTSYDDLRESFRTQKRQWEDHR